MATRSGGGNRAGRHYREQMWAPLWVMAIIWLACGAAIFGTVQALRDTSLSAADAWPVLAAAAGASVLLLTALNLFFIRLDVEVRSDHVLVAFGPVNLVRKRIWFTEIEEVRGLTYRPLMEFGGWGIRFRPGRTAWTIRGNQAAAVKLKSGRRIYVGSEHPQRLAGAIMTAMRGTAAAAGGR